MVKECAAVFFRSGLWGFVSLRCLAMCSLARALALDSVDCVLRALPEGIDRIGEVCASTHVDGSQTRAVADKIADAVVTGVALR